MSFTPVGVQILVATHEKYLFRSLYTKQQSYNIMSMWFYLNLICTNLNLENFYEKICFLHTVIGFNFIDFSFIKLFRIDAAKATPNCKYLSGRIRTIAACQSRRTMGISPQHLRRSRLYDLCRRRFNFNQRYLFCQRR